jgi:hypothetical protein
MTAAFLGGCGGGAIQSEDGQRDRGRATDWLALAAAPIFAIMALWNALFGGQPDMVCMAMQDSSALSGMTMMYLLMSVFHLSPWLTLLAHRLNGAQCDRTAFANPGSSIRS